MPEHIPTRAWLIVGCGYVGQAVGHLALASGAADAVVGIRRRDRPHPHPWRICHADVTQADWWRVLPRWPFACVIFCAAPHVREQAVYQAVYVEGLRQVLRGLGEHQSTPPRVLFTSSTGVFDEDQGAWVDEQTLTLPTSPRVATLLEAEMQVRQLGDSGRIVRFGGIYGPGRRRLVDRALQSPLVLRPRPHYTNHIHLDDCAGSVVHVAQLDQAAPLYVAVDHRPVDYNALLLELAGTSGSAAPLPALPDGPASGKRCDSSRLRASGYVFRYPRYTANTLL